LVKTAYHIKKHCCKIQQTAVYALATVVFIFIISISGCILSRFLQLFIKTLLIALFFLCCKHHQTTVGLSSFALISIVNHIFVNQADSQKINLYIRQGLQQSHGSGLEKSGAIFSFCQGRLKVIFLIVSWAVASFFQPFMQTIN